MNTKIDILIKVENLKKYFPVTRGIFRKSVAYVKAVDGVSFQIERGKTFGLVGESGCGKTTTGRCLLQLIRATEGQIWFDGTDICQITPRELQKYRQKMQVVFQDPYSSLNPRMTIGSIIEEPLKVHRLEKGKEARELVKHYMNIVGLDSKMFDRYPHELSGGQRQRVGLARALVLRPSFILGDEPVSALDVSIQAQVINLLMEIQAQFNTTYLIIAHNLSVVRHISHKVGVMYLGKIVEVSPQDELYEHAVHPYTRALLSAVPVPDPRVETKRQRIILSGEPPSPLDPPSGCRFHPRCSLAKDICKELTPALKDLGGEHYVACHLASFA